MTRFFFLSSSEGAPTPLERTGGAGATDLLALEDAGRLPDPVLCVAKPRSPTPSMPFFSAALHVHFVLFGNKGHDGESLKVVAMDDQGRAFMCDPSLPPVFLPLPPVVSPPKRSPFSFTVGDGLYVMDGLVRPAAARARGTTRLRRAGAAVQLPGSDYIDSHAVVAGGTDILVSYRSGGTYRFDTVESTWEEAALQPLPFSGLAEYVPEHELWFGLSSSDDGSRFMATADLERPFLSFYMDMDLLPGGARLLDGVRPATAGVVVPSKVRAPGILQVLHRQVLQGLSGRLRDFQMLLTGVGVESCGKELRVVKHKSERYKLTLSREYNLI
ncbi:hypothetical protein BS78_07G024800 [Paspalum vaginatum]|nr:hypothetical protein BS78_07G024800 [Paspalum vaginatum]